LLIIADISFGKPLLKKLHKYKIKGIQVLSLNMILPAILIAWLNKKINFKNSNGDKKKHAKSIQVLIADLKSARKNTIETIKTSLTKGFPKKIFGMINNCHVAIFAQITIGP